MVPAISHRPIEKLAVFATPPPSPAAYRNLAFDPSSGDLQAGQFGGMEGNEQQGRQYEQPGYPRGYVPDLRGTPASNIAESLDPRTSPDDAAPARFRQSHVLAARRPMRASVDSVGGNASDLGSFGYAQGQQYPPAQMQGTPLQYSPEFAQDPHRQQPFPPYAAQVMFNVSPQTPQQSPYDAVPSFHPRQSTAIEVLSTQFNVPQYYNPSETTNTSGPASVIPQYASTEFHPPLQYQPSALIAQPGLASSYPMADLAQSGGPDEPEPQNQGNEALKRAYEEYQQSLRQVFENIHGGRLTEAGPSLLKISEWLLDHVGQLGMSKIIAPST